MDIKGYFKILWRRKWIVLVTTIAAVIVAIVGTSLIKPVYQASTTLRVAASVGGNLNFTASTYSNQLINTTAKIASSRKVLEDLVESLDLNEEPVITTEVIPATELIKITVEYPDPIMAAKIANALANTLIIQSNELYTGGGRTTQEVLAEQITQYQADLEKTRQEYEALLVRTPPAPERVSVTLDLLQVKQRNYEELLIEYDSALLQEEVHASMMTIVEEAVTPKSPIEPRALYNYVLALAAGLFSGVVLAFAVEGLDSTLYTAKDVENIAGLPILAKIPKAQKQSVLMASEDASPAAEVYRSLALNIMMTDHQPSKKIILIIGAEPKQGKSTIVHNLAMALSEYEKKVIAVDCDMRLPKLHEYFNVANQSGLKELIEQKNGDENPISIAAPGVSVLSSRSQPGNPSQLLGSPQMAKVIKGLREQFDYILLDTPALLSVSDTAAILENAELVKNVGAILLVVRLSQAKREAVEAAGKFIKAFADKRAGIVLNQADVAISQYYFQNRYKENKPEVANTMAG